MRNRFVLLALAAAFGAPLTAQNDLDKIAIETTKVAGTVYMLTGAGGNIGVSAGEDGIVIIDDQFAPLAHYHGDHTGGNEIFGREAPIIAHENAAIVALSMSR